MVSALHHKVTKMGWIRSSLVTGFQSFLSGQSLDRESRMQTALEDIREAMLDGLSARDVITATKLELRVTYASDLNDLWYLRGDVMAAIAATDGEAVARRKLDHISKMFKGLLPKSQTTRNTNLGF